jgi:hypothetical protein
VPHKRPRYFLADLLAIVASCGLVLAFIRTGGHDTGVGGPLTFALVFVALLMYRLWRGAVICDECGQRFSKQAMRRSPSFCPRCSIPQLRYPRGPNVLNLFFWGVLSLTVLTALPSIALVQNLASAPPGFIAWVVSSRIIVIGGLMLPWVLFFVTLVARFGMEPGPPEPRPCEKCGTVIPPAGVTEPQICPRCRLQYLSPEQLRKKQANGWWMILGALLLAGLATTLVLHNWAASCLGLSSWIAVPLITVTAMLGLAAVFLATVLFIVIPVRLVRTRCLRSEQGILASASKASGEGGEVLRNEAAIVWYSGPTNPVPLLLEAMEETRCRFESLLGRELVSRPPRILCFQRRDAFHAFLKPFAAPYLNFIRAVDGIHFRQPHRILTVCTEPVPYRVVDVERTTRALFYYHYIFAFASNGSPAPWLQRGISKALTSDDHDRTRLNRKMLVSLSRGTTWAADLFTLSDKELVKLLRSWRDHRTFARFEQFSAEAWSLFEYLGGTPAPPERRDRFREFLNESKLKNQPDNTFQRHLGFGFDHLFASWREWVLLQGIGSFMLPSAPVEDWLFTRVIPLVEDSHAKAEHRILAIRYVGVEGYVLGADALIGLLQGCDVIPREEVVWALESISGMPYGDDRERWAAWWDSIPAEIRERRQRRAEVSR